MKKLKMQFLQNGIIQHVSLPKLSQHNLQVFHQRRKFACVTFSVERAKEFGINESTVRWIIKACPVMHNINFPANIIFQGPGDRLTISLTKMNNCWSGFWSYRICISQFQSWAFKRKKCWLYSLIIHHLLPVVPEWINFSVDMNFLCEPVLQLAKNYYSNCIAF